jgi:hypothetical protein
MAAQDIEVVLQKSSKSSIIGIHLYKNTYNFVGYSSHYDDNDVLKRFGYRTQRMSQKNSYKDRYGYEFSNGRLDKYEKELVNNSDGRTYFIKYFEKKYPEYPGLPVLPPVNYGGFKTDK